jgi:hypothetical protein
MRRNAENNYINIPTFKQNKTMNKASSKKRKRKKEKKKEKEKRA